MAFLLPDSGYKMAQRLQNTKSVPSTSKVYPALEKLVKAGYLTYDKNKYRHNPARLVEDLIDHLWHYDVAIEENEKKILQNMLTSGYIFNMLSTDVYEELHTRKSGSHDIDALEFFRNKIGMFSTMFLHLKKISPQPEEPIRESFEKINEQMSGLVEHVNSAMSARLKGSATYKKNKMFTYDLLSNTMKSMVLLTIVFQRIPDSTLEKFSQLWDQYQGFMMGAQFGKFNSMEELEKFADEQMDSL